MMKCPRCGGENFNQIAGLSILLGDAAGKTQLGVKGIHCDRCNLLMLELNPAAVPKESIRHIENEWGGAAL